MTLTAETVMDGAIVQPVESDSTIDLRTTGEWERPALAKVTAEPLDLSEDAPSAERRPGLLSRTLHAFTR